MLSITVAIALVITIQLSTCCTCLLFVMFHCIALLFDDVFLVWDLVTDQPFG